MRRLGSLPLAHQPGEQWLYHMSAEILGVLIARVSGKSLGNFLQERIFAPLGMTDTGFHVPESKFDRLPTCYGRDMVTGELVVLDEPRPATPRAAGLRIRGRRAVSTVDDLLAFGRMMLLHGGGERILSRPAIQ
jgi:CubicO group peptidase (beta-lactamase class C family)